MKLNCKKAMHFIYLQMAMQISLGGPNKKKFRYKSFRELLVKVSKESFSTQKEILDNTIEEWMGNIKQVDDILVIGVRVLT